MAAHSHILAWKMPWAEEPGGLQSVGSWKVGHDWAERLTVWLFRYRVLAGEDAKLLEMNGGDVITIMWKFLMPLNVHLNMIKMEVVWNVYFTMIKNKQKRDNLPFFS